VTNRVIIMEYLALPHGGAFSWASEICEGQDDAANEHSQPYQGEPDIEFVAIHDPGSMRNQQLFELIQIKYREKAATRWDNPHAHTPDSRISPRGVLSPRAAREAANCGRYCLSVGAVDGGSGAGSIAGAAPLSSAAPTQSPAHILVPRTVPTSLQPMGACGFACADFFAAFGGAV
jgi:hypothetical protein